jgi:hypothetical protein
MTDFTSSFPDFSTLSTAPDISSFLQPAVQLAPSPSGGIMASFTDFANNITNAAKTFYGAQAQITNAQPQAALAKAIGKNQVSTAQSGLPSPNLLLLGGAGLLAILLLNKKQ